MKRHSSLWALVFAVFVPVILLVSTNMASEVPRITKEQLLTMLDHPNILIVDVRAQQDWYASETLIKGAVRENPKEIEIWIDQYPKDKIIVFYCA